MCNNIRINSCRRPISAPAVLSASVLRGAVLSVCLTAAANSAVLSAQDAAPAGATVPAAAAETVKSAYPDKESGDRARAAMEYGTASSFYRQYRAAAQRAKDNTAEKDAYACELDALISANLGQPAQRLLDEYRERFPQADEHSVSLWQAEIFLVQRRLDDADKLLSKLIPSLEKLDPGILRALSCAAFIAELRRDHAAAVKYYGEISSSAGVKTAFGRRALERQALSLASLGRCTDAYSLLNSLPVAETKRDVDALKILSFYLSLREKGLDDDYEQWSAIRADAAPRKDNLFFLTASRIGEEFARRGDFSKAVEAYNLAYNFAAVREDASDALTRLIGSFQRLGDKKAAADLALRFLTLFKGAQLAPTFRLQIAGILFSAGKNDDAYDVCLSCISDTSIPQSERDAVYRQALDIMIAAKAFSSARKFVAAADTIPAKKTTRSFDMAEILWREGKPAEAAKLYRSIGDNSPSSRSEAYLKAMRCCLDAAKWSELLEISAVLRKSDGAKVDPDVIYLSAIAQERTGKLAEAAANYIAYEAAAPKNAAAAESRAAALYAAGRIFIRLGTPAKAIDVLRRLRQDYRTLAVSEPGHYWLIHAMYSSGDDVGAERESWRFIEDKPDSEYACSAMLRLAEHYRSTGSVSHAESTLDQLLEQNKYPKIRIRAMYEKAILAYQQDDVITALNLLAGIESETTDPAQLADMHYLRGDIARKNSDFSKARLAYEAAAKLVPGTLLEQAALGSAADCIYAAATGSAPLEPVNDASSAKDPSAPASEASTAGQAGKTPSKPASSDSGASAAAECKKAFDAYQSLLAMPNLRPEYRAMAIYKSAQSMWKAGDEAAAFDLFKQMIFLLPAKEAAARSVESFWIFRAVDALETLAHKDPAIPRVEAAVSALVWLGQTGVVDQASIRQRIKSLRKKQYQPPVPAASTQTQSEKSQP